MADVSDKSSDETFAEEITGKIGVRLQRSDSEIASLKKRVRKLQWWVVLSAFWVAEQAAEWLWMWMQGPVERALRGE